MLSKLKAEDQFLKDEIERLRSVFAALLGIFDNDSMYASLEPKMKHINSEQALILFFNVLNRFKPLIIYIEDVQWIDQDSMEIIRKLCVSRKNGCFLILMCARSEGSFKSDDIRLPEVKDIHRINLSYFNRDQLSQLVKTLLEQPASDEFLDYLLEKTSGNPFYSEQLVRHLNELNLIGKSYGKVCHFLSDVALPRDVNTLLIARLDRLISEVKETIQIASVLGRQFYLNILSALLQQREPGMEYGSFWTIFSIFSTMHCFVMQPIRCRQKPASVFCTSLQQEFWKTSRSKWLKNIIPALVIIGNRPVTAREHAFIILTPHGMQQKGLTLRKQRIFTGHIFACRKKLTRRGYMP
jgi:predicted ATPase